MWNTKTNEAQICKLILFYPRFKEEPIKLCASYSCLDVWSAALASGPTAVTDSTLVQHSPTWFIFNISILSLDQVLSFWVEGLIGWYRIWGGGERYISATIRTRILDSIRSPDLWKVYISTKQELIINRLIILNLYNEK